MCDSACGDLKEACWGEKGDVWQISARPKPVSPTLKSRPLTTSRIETSGWKEAQEPPLPGKDSSQGLPGDLAQMPERRSLGKQTGEEDWSHQVTPNWDLLSRSKMR
jgi:hypothetical protein